MKSKILLLFTFFLLISCKREQKITSSDWQILSERTKFKNDSGNFQLKTGKFSYNFDKNDLPFKKIVILNASMIGYVSELQSENQIVAVSSPEYIYSKKIQDLVKSGKIKNVGNDQKYDVEKILSLKPDAIFTNYIPNFENTYELLKNNGIKVVFLDEYLEQKPLEKTSYLKIFGHLLGKSELAEKKFREIENSYYDYKKFASSATSKPNILANEMYGNIWYLPGGKTAVAKYISDANANYILKENTEEKAVNMSFEEVYDKSNSINFWVNAGNHISKKEMLQINPLYSKLNVFTNGKVYAFSEKQTATANDFFESGVVRSDVVLKDYIKIFHPELFLDYKLTYFKELR
ncbi:iron complex transport system substrate-binding protein [Chryseobacterium piscicola]|uniref:ABC transporter substrate-binding protein n=1 Tax=Chryseobacterium piscicola TaxID=551459 RepID=A0A1N7LBU8_9FLAO|nr:ABC transporter substrate-binding protein [Chryseobacterium piscicola]PQA97507.1 ABC transporter substrate-binding protein [Chryseobacterium piscicola]SIS71269.1 iron complex transport system substrate-binding protein [Chryseobacterium piscicola]